MRKKLNSNAILGTVYFIDGILTIIVSQLGTIGFFLSGLSILTIVLSAVMYDNTQE